MKALPQITNPKKDQPKTDKNVLTFKVVMEVRIQTVIAKY